VAPRGPETSSTAKGTGPFVLSIRNSSSFAFCCGEVPVLDLAQILARHEFEIFIVNRWALIGAVVRVSVIAMEFVPELRYRAIYLSNIPRGGIRTKKVGHWTDIGSCGVGNL
jgi:hypothetical protein